MEAITASRGLHCSQRGGGHTALLTVRAEETGRGFEAELQSLPMKEEGGSLSRVISQDPLRCR